MKQKYPHLFTPLTIRGITLKNRILSAPLGIWGICPENGVPETTIRYFEERAAGGAATVVLGDTQVNAGDPEEEKVGKILHLRTSDAPIALLTEFADRIHQHGAVASIELAHVGGGMMPINKPEKDEANGKNSAMPGPPPGGFMPHNMINFGPMAYKTPFGETIAMTVEKIRETISQYAECAAAMKRSGFRMVTIHGGHEKLIDQFFAPSNTRDDDYGGSLENRMRFTIELIDAVRQAVGDEFIIEMRVSSRDPETENERFEELVTLANRLEGKIDILNASVAGGPGSKAELVTMPGYLQPPAPNAMRAAVLKERVNIPVSAVGAIISPDIAEEILATGKADFIAMCRPLIADPDFPRKARQGREKDIRPCIGCLRCIDDMHQTHVIRCSVNPRAGKEYSLPTVQTAVEKKKVAVIGGGLAGMQAAITAAGRGHDVTLFEKSDQLGGMLTLLAKDDLKYRLRMLRDYFTREMDKSGVNVRLNAQATKEMIEDLAPDSVILASGANPIIPDIRGINSKNVLNVRDAYDRINNLPKRIAIVGGNKSGCELAASLNKRGHSVTLIEMQPIIVPLSGMMMDSTLERLMNGVTIETDALCTGIDEKGVIFSRDGKEHSVDSDVVIIAVGMEADRSLADGLRFVAPDYFETGDCLKVATVYEAVRTGYFSAMDV